MKEMVTGGGEGKIRVVDMANFQVLSTLDGSAGMIECFAFTASDKLLVFGTRTNVVKV